MKRLWCRVFGHRTDLVHLPKGYVTRACTRCWGPSTRQATANGPTLAREWREVLAKIATQGEK